MWRAITVRAGETEARRSYVAPHPVFRLRAVGSARVVAALAVLATTAPRALWSQAQGSFGFGIGSARYTDGTSLSAATLSSAFQFQSPALAASGGGTVASLPLGVWSGQGRADLWAATPAAWGRLRFGVEGIGAGTTRSDGGWTAAAHGVAEVLWAGRTWGFALGAGPSGGWIVNEPSVTALHTRARAWSQVGAATYAVTIEPTRFLGAWFTDVGAGLTATTGAVITSLWATGRISSAYGSKAGGGALVQVFPVPNVALELGGGSYLSDPYQGLPRAGYVTAGIRLFTSRRAVSPAARSPAWPPLIPERRGDSVVVRFRMAGATAVALGGDWDGWQPRGLQFLGGDLWEGALPLRSGTYHFNLLVDGQEWVVPSGVAVVSDGLGGMAGVLVVP